MTRLYLLEDWLRFSQQKKHLNDSMIFSTLNVELWNIKKIRFIFLWVINYIFMKQM